MPTPCQYYAFRKQCEKSAHWQLTYVRNPFMLFFKLSYLKKKKALPSFDSTIQRELSEVAFCHFFSSCTHKICQVQGGVS